MNRLKHSILSTEQITKYERTVRGCKPIWLATRQRLSANIRSAQQTASAADSNITTCSSSIAARGPTSLLFTVGTGGPFPGESGWGMQLATHLHLVPALSMRGAIPPLPLYVSMVCKRKTLPLTLPLSLPLPLTLPLPLPNVKVRL